MNLPASIPALVDLPAKILETISRYPANCVAVLYVKFKQGSRIDPGFASFKAEIEALVEAGKLREIATEDIGGPVYQLTEDKRPIPIGVKTKTPYVKSVRPAPAPELQEVRTLDHLDWLALHLGKERVRMVGLLQKLSDRYAAGFDPSDAQIQKMHRSIGQCQRAIDAYELILEKHTK